MKLKLGVATFFTLTGGLLFTAPAHAIDDWSEPYAGIEHLHRSTTEPKEIHALVIDLTSPAIFLQATSSAERGQTVTAFASQISATAAVNGDFFNMDGSYAPTGLAIGEGVQWTDGTDSAGHSFIACDVYKNCEIDRSDTAVAVDPNWWSAVGGNHVIIDQGTLWTADQDTACGSFCTTLHPRTAAGISEDGNTLILVVVEGRQDPIFGMSLSQLATLMDELGAHDALNLDGGGSSAMVLDGSRVSNLPSAQGGERAVANHLAVIYDSSAATTGRLVGYVREGDIGNTDAPITDALIELSTGQSAHSDETGFYDFPDVAPGVVDVTASKAGYLPSSETKEVVGGITNWRSLALQPTPDAGVPDAALPDTATAPDAARPDTTTAPDTASTPDTMSVPDNTTAPDRATAPDLPGGTDLHVVLFPDGGAEGGDEVDGGCQCQAAPGGAGMFLVGLAALAATRGRRKMRSDGGRGGAET